MLICATCTNCANTKIELFLNEDWGGGKANEMPASTLGK